MVDIVENGISPLAGVNIKKIKYFNFQEDEKKRRENLDKIMEENQKKIDEQQKKMVSKVVIDPIIIIINFRPRKGLR